MTRAAGGEVGSGHFGMAEVSWHSLRFDSAHCLACMSKESFKSQVFAVLRSNLTVALARRMHSRVLPLHKTLDLHM